jgi:hypothetical protein
MFLKLKQKRAQILAKYEEAYSVVSFTCHLRQKSSKTVLILMIFSARLSLYVIFERKFKICAQNSICMTLSLVYRNNFK